ncbi:MAG TPA: LysM peptidoglycan-binding domain-containing protein [Smithellaceae bacterium]|nr:LysM peptidoglycan-binding domain-containing protein [Smithellaceae bacterium]HRS82397.1 LysM peptidoglycan-binding domain-containing protein [Smithellaceae bacterium]HRV44986.1 LysM peptidoglycan-binding domain-containing protein [Smithellaceae bacterium]
MTHLFSFPGLVAILSAVMFCFPVLSAQEDSAQLTFRKTAYSKKSVQFHTVRKNEAIYGIIRNLPGVTEKDIPRYLQIIKTLNPQVQNWNKIYPGQKIALPSKSDAGAREETNTSSNDSLSTSSGYRTYRVKKGDYLIRIVHRNLNISSNTQQAMLRIKELNPSIRDANLLYPGQVIRLPAGGRQVAAASPPETSGTNEPRPEPEALSDESPAQASETGSASATISEEPSAQPEKTQWPALSPGMKLEIIRHILKQMQGNLMTKGNYYLPISKTAQLTIDCSSIPIAELNDQTTVFLDMKNRSSASLKKLIGSGWSNLHIVNMDAKDDVIVILKKIFGKSKGYEIVPAEKPIVLGAQPEVEIPVDWLINRKGGAKPSKTIQGIRLVYQNRDILPRAITLFARSHSLIITEFSPQTGLASPQEELYSLPPLTVFPKSPAADLGFAMLTYLKLNAERNEEIRIFNLEKDGFDLSLRVDIMVSQDKRKTAIFSRLLPQEFIDELRKTGHELIFIANQDDPATNLEKILRGVNVPFTSGYFLFSGADHRQPPYTIRFKGIKVKNHQDVYVVDFDVDHDLLGLLKEAWSATLVRY